MARWQGTTRERGLAGTHPTTRQRELAVMAEGQLCARCELRGISHPLTRALITRRLDGRYVAPMLDLDDFPGRRYGGPQVKRLSHRSCNRRAGQQVTAAINRARGGLTQRQLLAIRMKQWKAAARQW